MKAMPKLRGIPMDRRRFIALGAAVACYPSFAVAANQDEERHRRHHRYAVLFLLLVELKQPAYRPLCRKRIVLRFIIAFPRTILVYVAERIEPNMLTP